MVSIKTMGEDKFNPEDERVKKALQNFAQIHQEAVQIKANELRDQLRPKAEELERLYKSSKEEDEAHAKKTRRLVTVAEIGIVGSFLTATLLAGLGIDKFLESRRGNKN